MNDPAENPDNELTQEGPSDLNLGKEPASNPESTTGAPTELAPDEVAATGAERTGDESTFSVDDTFSGLGPAQQTFEADVQQTNRSLHDHKRSNGRRLKAEVPEMIGRYRVESTLGEGGFGCVYLAWDDDLQRNVTVKVPHNNRVRNHLDVQAFLAEARTLAKLEHPNIVPVHDVGHTLQGICFIVSRYIDGNDLYKRIKVQPLNVGESVSLIATVARAVHYAHTHGVIHRDIKPNNILLDKRGTPYLADFGLALLEENAARSSNLAGTPSYMSPEQARGENHLVQGTSDIFALGIVLYELIVGHRPFRGETTSDVLRAIQEDEVQRFRDLNGDIPAELERICMKSLSKRALDRHNTALDFAEDLDHFLSQNEGLHLLSGASTQAVVATGSMEQSRSSRQFLGIVPKGLRSFGPDDAHFFLGLLPGPYNRNGMPESILFWRRRIEELDPDEAFRVGLIYGPSGCGKSSFVKAGLIPTLSPHVTAVAIEAAVGATENRLLNRLRRQCPYLDTELGLRESIATLRHGNVMGEGKKVLIVIDQFEQWLYSVDQPEHSELAKALRQCDGEHVQCILMVRDDFWLAFTRFMDHLEIELMQNRNMAMIDLFDKSHAKRVLTEFGRAFHRLPERASETSRDQNLFVSNAIDDLAENGKVTPVRLALFAEMVKGKTWSTATLKKIGGTAGVGVMFLDENFVADSAPLDYRMHKDAVYATLAELLPAPGANLKGHMKSREELLRASGYSEQPKQFQGMMRALDSELHLITRTDPEGKGDQSVNLSGSQSASVSTQVYYQLAHDYLVPSIRQWQVQMQQGTRKGRAEIRSAQRAEVWRSHPETRHLPTWIEWATILVFTKHDRWDDSQQRMMKAATHRHTTSTLIVVAAMMLAVFGLFQYAAWDKAKSLTGQLKITNVAEAPRLLEQLAGRERWSASRLRAIQDESAPDSRSYLFASIALLDSDASQVEKIRPFLQHSDPETLRLVCNTLEPYRTQLVQPLWERLGDQDLERVIDDDGRPFSERFNAGLALAKFDPPRLDELEHAKRWHRHADYLADELIFFRNIDMQFYSSLLELAKPLAPIIATRLSSVISDFDEVESRRESSLSLLTDLFADRPVTLARHMMHGGVEQLAPKAKLFEKHRDEIRPLLDRYVKKEISMRDPMWRRAATEKANAAALLLRLGASSDAIWSVFKPDAVTERDVVSDLSPEDWIRDELKRLLPEDAFEKIPADCDLLSLQMRLAELTFGRSLNPTARTKLVQRVRGLGVDPSTIARRLLIESDVDVRCGLLQALGNYQATELDDDLRDHVVTAVKGWFRTSAEASIHANAFWFLNLDSWGNRQWVQGEIVPSDHSIKSDRQWYVNQSGQTMIQLPQHDPLDEYRIDAAMGEVTLGQLRQWSTDPEKVKYWSGSSLDCAVGQVSYQEAVEYCNWLSIANGLGEDQLCYPVREQGGDDPVELVADYQLRSGYRLATANEYFFMASSGCLTDYSFGSSASPTALEGEEELWDGYSANLIGDGDASWPIAQVRPNGFGIFDTYMNVREWTSTARPIDRNQRQICGSDYRYHWGMNGISPYYIGWADVTARASFWGLRVVRSRPVVSDNSK
ncbi:bifunctional serine/threonine-protein kinase/formylglycine-generating enzyme family protein [Planctomycetes bacterium K23_9]|uniref:Serine/threonine-protein kinase StkP n=1 Tax=Stieleria marina TaxID=1930275 RepID=A0A517NZQ1_9BACT|nr:Serine/threonine-protein kinase StkP [Planctomycetes bacterium K23_9]